MKLFNSRSYLRRVRPYIASHLRKILYSHRSKPETVKKLEAFAQDLYVQKIIDVWHFTFVTFNDPPTCKDLTSIGIEFEHNNKVYEIEISR